MKRLLPVLLAFVFFACGGTENAGQKDSAPPAKTENTKPSAIDLQTEMRYAILSERPAVTLTDDSLKTAISDWLAGNKFQVDSLVDFAQRLTAQRLSFSFEKWPSDPNEAAQQGRANCVGYAAVFNSVMNFALEKSGNAKQYECRHHVGKISYRGEDVHKVFTDPFFADHDFNVIKKRDGTLTIAVDPSLFEYLGVKRVLLEE